jgi:tRNA A-37 threonylcarbamoyl transferase component Bud32
MSDGAERLGAALEGRYRLERQLGQGGMATVYLAQDLKHDRQVAIKVLKPELAAVLGADRFVQEIKTTAALQHPHILPLFDSGSADGFLYYVMPYIEGETLRTRLDRDKQLGIEEAVRITREVADALDYAHRHGVIHRDIKPENILLHDGRPMVADFGIALAVSAAAGGRMTETGLSLGTPHYMSPEQATADRDITARSDIYSLASVLYEMLTGEPPHMGNSAQQIIMKIVTDTARPVSELRKSVPPNVAAAVAKALEKLPADRFENAKAFAEALANPHFTTARVGVAGALMPAGVGGVRWLTRSPWWWATAAVAAGAVALSWLTARHAALTPAPLFTPRTFDARSICNARFMPDGQTMVFSGLPAVGTVSHLFVIRPDHPDPAPVGPDSVHLLSISRTGKLAVITHARYKVWRLFDGTLATMSLGGEAPREITTGVREADWAPDDTSMAVVRDSGGSDLLELPVGTVLARSIGYFSAPRVSPSGDAVAYIEHPSSRYDNRGAAVIVDRAGRTIARGPAFWGVEGIAWRPSGSGILYSAASGVSSNAYAIRELDRSGRDHLALSGPGNLDIQDISRTGRSLVTDDDQPALLFGRGPGSDTDVFMGVRDFSAGWLSGNGRYLAIMDAGALGGATYTTLVRRTDGSAPVVLGEGFPAAITTDGGLIVAFVYTTPPKIMLYPTGPGVARRIDAGRFQTFQTLTGGADVKIAGGDTTVFFCGAERERPLRCYVDSLSSGTLTAVTPPGTGPGRLSPDGSRVVAPTGNGWAMYPVGGGTPRPVTGLRPSDGVLRWSPDGGELWVRADAGSVSSIRIDRLDPETGARGRLLTIVPHDLTNVHGIADLSLSDDARAYVYGLYRYSSRLYTVDALR